MRLLRSRGATVEVFDDRQAGQLVDGATVRTLDEIPVSDVDVIVTSPGVPRSRLAAGIAADRVIGEIELASWFLREPLIGITGTNGKSTTTSLIAHGLAGPQRRVFAGGNLGVPLSEFAGGSRDAERVVVELSSYQLESLVLARFAVSVWLNLSPDHLDRYPSVEDYAQAKRRLVECTDEAGVVVLNADDPFCRLDPPAQVRWISARPSPTSFAGTAVVAPGRLRRCVGDRFEEYAVDSPALLGAHNDFNAAAAVEVWRREGLSEAEVEHALSTFPGLPHRLERLATDDGRAWFNDSKATNVAAACVALDAVTGPKVLIAGGRGKGESWQPLVERALEREVRLVVAFGESRAQIAEAFAPRMPVQITTTLSEAVDVARRGEAMSIVFSPACASFDQFDDFEHRGETFRALIQRTAP